MVNVSRYSHLALIVSNSSPMKKVYASLLMVFLLHLAHAQNTIPIRYSKEFAARSASALGADLSVAKTGQRALIFNEDFESGTFPPAGWNVASGPTSTITNPALQTWHEALGNPGMAAAIDFANSTDVHDEWLISPAIQLPNGPVRLKFDFITSSYWHVNPNDNADIICTISAAGGTVADLAAGDSIFWEEADSIVGAWNNFEWTTFQTTLSAYAGQTVYIGFHYLGQDAAQLNIDNVLVEEIPVHALIYEAVYDADILNDFEHRLFNYAQRRPFTFMTLIKNDGYATQQDVFVDFEVIDDSGNVVSTGSSSTVNSILPSVIDTLVVETQFTPPNTEQVYTINLRLRSDSINGTLPENLATRSLEVKQFYWGRERGPADGAFQNVIGGGTGAIEIGATYFATDFDFANGIQIFISDSSPMGQDFFGALYLLNGFDYVEVARSNDVEVNFFNRGEWVNLWLSLPSALQINPGDQLLATVGHYGGAEADQPAFGLSGESVPFTVLGFDDSGNIFQLEDPRVPMVRIFYDPLFDSIEEEALLNFTLKQNVPNPSIGVSQIQYNLQEAGNVLFEVNAIDGRVIFQSHEGQKAAGDYSIALNTAEWAAGLYSFTLTVDGRRASKRMVVR